MITSIYVLAVGAVLIAVGIAEMAAPLRAFAVWRAWSSKRAFFLHGLVLIAAGLPLTIYRGPGSIPVFIIGIIAVLTGPFILIFPDTIRRMFQKITEEMKNGDILRTIRIEAFLRILAGAVCVISSILAL